MTRKNPGAKRGRPIDWNKREKRLNLMARTKAERYWESDYKASERASDTEAETNPKPTDPRQFRRDWGAEVKAAKANTPVPPDGEFSHPRYEQALYEEARKCGLTLPRADGKPHLRKPKSGSGKS